MDLRVEVKSSICRGASSDYICRYIWRCCAGVRVAITSADIYGDIIWRCCAGVRAVITSAVLSTVSATLPMPPLPSLSYVSNLWFDLIFWFDLMMIIHDDHMIWFFSQTVFFLFRPMIWWCHPGPHCPMWVTFALIWWRHTYPHCPLSHLISYDDRVMVIVWWWLYDDDDRMMMIVWWWLYDDDLMMMMMLYQQMMIFCSNIW